MYNKDLIKKLLTLPLDYKIKVDGEELFSIVSEKTFEENTISFNSPPKYIKDLPKSEGPYDLGHHNSLKRTWINPDETFFMKNYEDEWVGVKFVGEFINKRWWGYQFFEAHPDEPLPQEIWFKKLLDENIKKRG